MVAIRNGLFSQPDNTKQSNYKFVMQLKQDDFCSHSKQVSKQNQTGPLALLRPLGRLHYRTTNLYQFTNLISLYVKIYLVILACIFLLSLVMVDFCWRGVLMQYGKCQIASGCYNPSFYFQKIFKDVRVWHCGIPYLITY